MTKSALLKSVTRGAAQMRRTNHQLRAEMAQDAARIAQAREAEYQHQLEAALKAHIAIAKRLGLALEGLANLSALGRTKAFRSLLQAQQRPLMLYGGEKITCAGGDMSDVHWKWVGYIALTATSLRLASYTETSGDYGRTFKPDVCEKFTFEFSYRDKVDARRAEQLLKIATAYACDVDQILRRGGVNEVYDERTLFQVLVDCADEQRYGEYVRWAMTRP